VDRGTGEDAQPAAGPSLSVIVPVLDDAAAAAGILAQIKADPHVDVLIVDGGSDAELGRLAGRRPLTRVIRTTAGRARQMNAGARESTGEWLLFLHADSQLPPGWRAALAGLGPHIVGGWFRFALDDAAWQARVIERLVAWRVRAMRLPYGDQGFFVRRDVFARLGGFQDLPLLEDVEFVRRLVAAGAVAELPLPLRTSARRWKRDGWFRRSLRNSLIVALYFGGVAPSRLARWYGR
jgi:rSAM/selenodomain-associated transferase 2